MAREELLLALCAMSQTRRRLSATVEDLRRRLHDEYLRYEHDRLVRMRHYLTVKCLQDPEHSSCGVKVTMSTSST
ncbi:hypothetical protein PHYSODRAFT_287346 [Phytophthora sojae]|uniref:Uncharacterized protein n=1 Tax=Phytophthora sojae (strain P6497) TaxID=1094619 RepID=G5A111_PHYSP|nr:hypothetical protein PHYSODRAFT_287346 [Phytophthora sojae]EGZ11443.1 hypothetical protein PHYSODRAFT_287346 [Phytophthora sojae]|eukprot:XP_009534188.1 hypothetical protein PHYSODRAFT_287346 [Phytophthora sojae]